MLRDGTVNDKGRSRLRLHRQKNGVDSLHHLRVLKKLGWTLDQLEEGKIGGLPSLEAPPPATATRE